MIFKGSSARKIETRMTMCRSSSGFDEFYHLTVEDKASGQLIVDVRMTAEEFAKLVTGCGTTGRATAYVNENIGKNMETMEIQVNYTAFEDAPWDEFVRKSFELLKATYPDWTPDNPGEGPNGHKRNYQKPTPSLLGDGCEEAYRFNRHG